LASASAWTPLPSAWPASVPIRVRAAVLQVLPQILRRPAELERILVQSLLPQWEVQLEDLQAPRSRAAQS
jgi:hypothetical protein